MQTIAEAKTHLRDNWEEGTNCPCCGQKVKLWRKKPISTAVASLCKLVKMYDGKALHLDKFNVVKKDRNFNQLVLWGLIRPEYNEGETKRASGEWHPTAKGIMFVNEVRSIRKYVYTYDNKVVKFSDETITVREALGNKFNYQELIEENYS